MTPTQSYRVTVQVAEPDSLNQIGLKSTFGLKARSMTEAQILARHVSALPVRCVVRQDRGSK